MAVEEPGQQCAALVEVGDDLIEPRLAVPERGDVRDDARVARAVRRERSHLLPQLPVGLAGEDDLRALEAWQVPGLGGGRRGERVRGRRGRRRRVRDMRLPWVDQRRVYLVREDPAAVAVDDGGELRHLFQREHAAERVARAAEDDQVPAGQEGVLDRVEVEGEEPVLVVHLYLDDVAAQQAGHDQERHVRGRRQDDRRARPRVVRDRDLERLDHVRDRVYRRRIDGPAEPALLELRARSTQLLGELRRQVAEGRIGGQPGQGVEDGRRGTEVHLGDGRSETAGARRRPLVAAAGPEHRGGGGIDRVTEACGHTAILHRAIVVPATGWYTDGAPIR